MHHGDTETLVCVSPETLRGISYRARGAEARVKSVCSQRCIRCRARDRGAREAGVLERHQLQSYRGRGAREAGVYLRRLPVLAASDPELHNAADRARAQQEGGGCTQ